MSDGHFDSYGGGIHGSAIIGQKPEDGHYRPGQGSSATIHHPSIDPTARIEAFVTVDSGLAAHTRVDQGAWLLKHVHIGHDAYVGRGAVIATGTVVGGYACIGEGAKVGINATILPFRRIGPGAEIGAGSVVTRDVPAGEVWAGNPARPLGEKNEVPYTERAVGMTTAQQRAERRFPSEKMREDWAPLKKLGAP